MSIIEYNNINNISPMSCSIGWYWLFPEFFMLCKYLFLILAYYVTKRSTQTLNSVGKNGVCSVSIAAHLCNPSYFTRRLEGGLKVVSQTAISRLQLSYSISRVYHLLPSASKHFATLWLFLAGFLCHRLKELSTSVTLAQAELVFFIWLSIFFCFFFPKYHALYYCT